MSRRFSLKRIRSGSTSKPTPTSTSRRSAPSCRGFENAQRRRMSGPWCTPSSCVGSDPRSRARPRNTLRLRRESGRRFRRSEESESTKACDFLFGARKRRPQPRYEQRAGSGRYLGYSQIRTPSAGFGSGAGYRTRGSWQHLRRPNSAVCQERQERNYRYAPETTSRRERHLGRLVFVIFRDDGRWATAFHNANGELDNVRVRLFDARGLLRVDDKMHALQ